MSHLIVVLGPTAGGKSDLAAGLAQRLGGQVIGADSMQIYRHLEAGTAKPSAELRQRVAHHLIDIVEPWERFTVHDWLGRAQGLLDRLQSQGASAVVVGGTNLYLKALLEGLFDGPGQAPAFRAALAEQPAAALHERLGRLDPVAAQDIAPADRQRITRALEVHHLTGRPISDLQRQWAEHRSRGCKPAGPHTPTDPRPLSDVRDALLVGLRWPIERINGRINRRVKAMFHPQKVDPALAAAMCPTGESLPEEVRRLDAAGLLSPGSQAAEALGYKQCLAALAPDRHRRAADAKIKTLDDAFERTKILTRRFAKQQRTWLKRFAGVHWIDCDDLATPAARLDAALRHCQRA